jgi:phosphatidylinositol-bisphosphatase
LRRCDRILWKTTIEPSPSPEPSPVLQHHHMLSPPPKKVGGFRGLFRAKSAKIPRRPSTLVVPSAGDSSPEFLPPLKTAPPLSQTIFVPGPDENTSASVIPGKRRVSAASPPPSAPAERANKRVTAFGVLISPLSGGDSAPSRWRWPNFLSPGRGDSTDREMTIEEQVTPVVTPAIVRRRGEVDCLDYNTLDDRRMRRLEGRSDHRPVLGTFVMYI